MGLKINSTLTDIGLPEIETDLYMNVAHVALQTRPDGMILAVTLNIWANEKARRDDKRTLGQLTFTAPYDKKIDANILAHAYAMAKASDQLKNAEDA